MCSISGYEASTTTRSCKKRFSVLHTHSRQNKKEVRVTLRLRQKKLPGGNKYCSSSMFENMSRFQEGSSSSLTLSGNNKILPLDLFIDNHHYHVLLQSLQKCFFFFWEMAAGNAVIKKLICSAIQHILHTLPACNMARSQEQQPSVYETVFMYIQFSV